MEPVGWSSKIGFHVRPESVVFQTPPLLTPMKKTLGWPGTPTAPTVRPPRNGPIIRQRMLSYDLGVSAWQLAAGARAKHTHQDIKATAKRFVHMVENSRKTRQPH